MKGGMGEPGGRRHASRRVFLLIGLAVWSAAVLCFRVARGVTPPGLPQIRTCRFPASGSSGQPFAPLRYTEWTTRGGGSGFRPSSSHRSDQRKCALQLRLSSHFRQIPATSRLARFNMA